MAITTVSPQQLCDLAKSGTPVDLIDVRTPAEFQEVHVPFARNVPLDRLDTAKIACSRNSSPQPLYLICRSGARGKQACEKFVAAGYTNIVNVEGGTLAWDQAGFPVVRGKKTMSLERQVRLVAGLLIVTGALLGYFVHPYWIALAGMVGAGLVHAAVTDSCAMGLLLARMPWNQACGTTPASSAQVEAGSPSSASKKSCCS